MFRSASSFNADISRWDVSSIESSIEDGESGGLSGFLTGATMFVQDLRPWISRGAGAGGLPASAVTTGMHYLVLSATARSTLGDNSSLLALGNETDADSAACTGTDSAMESTGKYILSGGKRIKSWEALFVLLSQNWHQT